MLTADKVVKNTMLWTTGAGLVPIPVLDLVAVTGFQLNMLRQLCNIYEVKFSKNVGKNIIASLVGGLAPSSLSMPAAGLIKMIPLVGQTVGAVTMPIFSGAFTYGVGKVFIKHFESGGTLLTFNSKKEKEEFTEMFKEGKEVVNSLKRNRPRTMELKQKEKWTVKEVADKFGVDRNVVYDWIERGVLKADRINKGSPYTIHIDAYKERELKYRLVRLRKNKKSL
ncbi:MAG: DUF697 domain-containing protein [Kiritimatiellae bacterium]|nr:DUF697 domain-containing protein [Kiritimatiellia bacterium]